MHRIFKVVVRISASFVFVIVYEIDFSVNDFKDLITLVAVDYNDFLDIEDFHFQVDQTSFYITTHVNLLTNTIIDRSVRINSDYYVNSVFFYNFS